MSRFILQLTGLVIVLTAIIYGLNAAYGPAIINPFAPTILLFMALLTLMTYWFTARMVAASPDNFLVAYLGGMVLRLLLSLSLVLVYFYRGGARQGHATWTFLGAFFALYFLCTGFEIWAVLSNLRPFSKKQVSEK